MQRILLASTILSAALLSACDNAKPAAEAPPPFSVVEATIPDMRKAMAEGRVTAEELVRQSLLRIAIYENVINAVIAVNPNALAEARWTKNARPANCADPCTAFRSA